MGLQQLGAGRWVLSTGGCYIYRPSLLDRRAKAKYNRRIADNLYKTCSNSVFRIQDVDLVTFSYLSLLLADKYNSLIRTAAAGPRSVALRTNEQTRSPVRMYEHTRYHKKYQYNRLFTDLLYKTCMIGYLGVNRLY